MNTQIIETASGILIMTRQGRKLIKVRFVDAAIAHYYTEA